CFTYPCCISSLVFLSNPPALTEIYPLSLHDALPILAIVPELRARWPRHALRVADMGSGAGLPGIILAICQPDWSVVCVDAVGKKTAFIRQAAGVLGLKNVRAEHGRIESMGSLQADLVISRAFASLSDFVRVAAHHRAPGGVMLAMKGQDPIAERAALQADTGWFVK